MWCSHHKTTTHNDADCRATPANGLNGNAHFAQVRPPSVPGICSSWDIPVRDVSDEKPCISLLAREVQPTAKPAKARVEEEKRARPFGSVQTAATEGWRTRPWPFTPRAEQATSFGRPVAEESSGWRTTRSLLRKLSWLRRRSSLHPRTAPTVTSPPLWHQRNLCQVRYGNLCQGEHQRLCQGEHQRLCKGEHQRRVE